MDDFQTFLFFVGVIAFIGLLMFLQRWKDRKSRNSKGEMPTWQREQELQDDLKTLDDMENF